MIRAKVSGFNAEVLQGAAAREEKLGAARGYLALARRALEPVPPRLRRRGRALGHRQVDPGQGPGTRYRRHAGGRGVAQRRHPQAALFGVAPTEKLPESAYTAEVSARVFETIARRAARLLAAGRAVVADGVYGKEEQRAAIEAAARQAGARFDGFWLMAPEAVLLERVEARRGDASDADRRIVLAQRRMDEASVAWRQLRADRPIAELRAEAHSMLES